MDSVDSLPWEMEWNLATIYDGMWILGMFAALIYAMHIRNMGDLIPSGSEHNQDVHEAGSLQPAVIDPSLSAERRESAI